jgi:hypothetical protein
LHFSKAASFKKNIDAGSVASERKNFKIETRSISYKKEIEHLTTCIAVVRIKIGSRHSL